MKLDTLFHCASMEPFPKPSMISSRISISLGTFLLGVSFSISPAFASYRGISHDAPGYDSYGTYHSAVTDRLGGMSICMDYDEQGRCLRTQYYRNTSPSAKDRTTSSTSKARRMDHTYVDQYGDRHYDPRFYKVYECGTQFRPTSCRYYYLNGYFNY